MAWFPVRSRRTRKSTLISKWSPNKVSYLFKDLNLECVVNLKPGGKKEIKIFFTPQEAKVIIASAVLNFKEGENTYTKILKMSGIGKFPYVMINEEKFNFEQMTVGKSSSKVIQLRNHS
jgi:hypothetical protein